MSPSCRPPCRRVNKQPKWPAYLRFRMVAIRCLEHNFETNDVDSFFDHLDQEHNGRQSVPKPTQKERFRCFTCSYESPDSEDFIRHIRAYHAGKVHLAPIVRDEHDP
jgi:hypothetical protein